MEHGVLRNKGTGVRCNSYGGMSTRGWPRLEESDFRGRERRRRWMMKCMDDARRGWTGLGAEPLSLILLVARPSSKAPTTLKHYTPLT